MMQQQMAAYASTAITTELIQKVLSQLFVQQRRRRWQSSICAYTLSLFVSLQFVQTPSDAADSKLFLAFFLGDCPGITFCSSMEPRLKKERLLLLLQAGRLSLEFDRGLIECVCLFLSVDVCYFVTWVCIASLQLRNSCCTEFSSAQPQTLPSLQCFSAEIFPLRGGRSGVLLIFCLTKIWSKFPGFWGSYSVMLVQKL